MENNMLQVLIMGAGAKISVHLNDARHALNVMIPIVTKHERSGWDTLQLMEAKLHCMLAIRHMAQSIVPTDIEQESGFAEELDAEIVSDLKDMDEVIAELQKEIDEFPRT